MTTTKFLVCSDIHGSEKSERATEACLSFCRDFKPDVRVIAGDLWDFASIRKGAGEDERKLSMRDDFDAGAGFARQFFKGGRENHLMLGNHDVRVWDLLESTDGAKADCAQMMIDSIKALAAQCKATLWPYDSRDGVLKLGQLNVVHGYHTGAAACAHHSRIYGNVLFGHVHSIESFQTPGLKQQEARAIGCLCSLNPNYANRKTGKLRWANGWAYGFMFSDGTYQLHQTREIEGKYHASTEVKSY